MWCSLVILAGPVFIKMVVEGWFSSVSAWYSTLGKISAFFPFIHLFIYPFLAPTQGFQCFSGLYFSTVCNQLDAQIVPDLTLENPFTLAAVSL